MVELYYVILFYCMVGMYLNTSIELMPFSDFAIREDTDTGEKDLTAVLEAGPIKCFLIPDTNKPGSVVIDPIEEGE